METIDLNADLGEGGPADAELLTLVTSCNVACGGHAGDADSMAATITAALASGVAVGAHPSYPDRDNFGRQSGFLRGEALYESLSEQVTELSDIAAELGAALTHVKPHGALYNDAVHDRELADIIAHVTAEALGEVALIGMAGSELEAAAQEHGVRFVAEGFVDRAYEADGTLVSRSKPNAVHQDINVVTSQAVTLALDGSVTAANGEVIAVRAQTLCVHGDTPGAAAIARAVRDVLQNRGVELHAPFR